MRLIDADALMLHAEQYRCGRGEYSRMVDVWHIENAPTIDVKNFVRYHMDEISRTIRYQLVEVDTKKTYCPVCGKRRADNETDCSF